MKFLSDNGKRKYLKYGAIGSFILGLVVMLVAQPWSAAALGPSYSPSRILVTYVVTTLMLVIPGLICVYLFTRRNRWIAPHGKYVKGQDYSVYSTYTLTAIAIVAAVYAVGGLPTGVNIDLPSLICAFSAVFFGAHVMFPAVLIGWFVRWAIGGAAFIPVPILGGAIGLIDAGVWAINGFLLWWILRSERFREASGRRKTGLFIVAILVMIGVWLVGWIFDYAFVGNPWGAFVGYATLAFSTWAATGVAFQVLGLFMGQNMYEKWTQ